MDIITIYFGGVVITILWILYRLKKEQETNPVSIVNSNDPEVKLALFLSIMLISAFWFIAIPWSIAEKFSSRNNDNF